MSKPAAPILLALQGLAEVAEGELKGLRVTDSDSVHDARVSLRKVHAILQLFGGQLKPSPHIKKALKRAKKLHVHLQNLRDAEVMLQLLKRFSQTRSDDRAQQAAALTDRVARLIRKRQAAAQALSRTGRLRLGAKKVRKAIAGMRVRTDSIFDGADWVHVCLDANLSKLSKRAAKAPLATASDSELHEFRIQVKQLRYLLELLADIGGIDTKSEVARLERAQDLLGEFHDISVLQKWLAKPSLDNLRAAALIELVQRRAAACQGEIRAKLAELTW